MSDQLAVVLQQIRKKRGFPVGGGKGYLYGYKYCQVCRKYIRTFSSRCPFCNGKLRFKPREREYRESFRKYIEVPEEILREIEEEMNTCR